MRQGPIAVGDAVSTGGGKLAAKWVIHAAVMGHDLQTDANFIAQADHPHARGRRPPGRALPGAAGVRHRGRRLSDLRLRQHHGRRGARLPFRSSAQRPAQGRLLRLRRRRGGRLQERPERPHPVRVMTAAAPAGRRAPDDRRRKPSLLYLSRDEVAGLDLPMADVLDAVEESFRRKGRGEVGLPAKIGVDAGGGAFAHAMPAFVPAAGALGMKWVGVFPGNPALGLPTVSGLIVLDDPATGLPVAVMDAAIVTALRTGASAGVAARFLAREGAAVAAIVGCGVQGARACGAGRGAARAARGALPRLERRRRAEPRRRARAAAFPASSCASAARRPRRCAGADVVVTAIPMDGGRPPLDAGLLGRGARRGARLRRRLERRRDGRMRADRHRRPGADPRDQGRRRPPGGPAGGRRRPRPGRRRPRARPPRRGAAHPLPEPRASPRTTC